jgi:histidinol phosphatase-like PHP family hydrolase
MKIVNQESDLHTHSLQFSDGLNTIDELVRMAGELGLKKLAITDHSDARTFPPVAYRVLLSRYGNVLNDVEVIFGVEADLLNDDGDICTTIQKQESEFLLLSAHPDTFKGNPKLITEAWLNAIERHHERIQFLGHPCDYFPHIRIDQVVRAANQYGVPIEVNTSHLAMGMTNLKISDKMIAVADQIIVNTDAHSLSDMTTRSRGFDYLRSKGLL